MNSLLVSSFLAAFAVDMASPILVALWVRRRLNQETRVWLYGAAVFLGFQVLTRIPLVLFIQTREPIQKALEESGAAHALYAFTLALSAGLFEEGGRWLGYRYLLPERTWPVALMYGAGHGGLESLGVGLLTLGSLIGYLTLASGIPAEALAALSPEHLQKVEEARASFNALEGWEPLLGGLERLATQACQLLFSVMVLLAFVRSARWWWYALAAHTWMNLSSALLTRAAVDALGQARGMLMVEALVTAYGVIALWLVVRLRRSGAAPA